MNVIQKTICASLALAGMACGGPLWAGERDSALQINQANELLRSGDIDSAIGAYQAASELAPESADLSYNLAVAQYRKGDVAAAEHLFQSAATSENDSLAARARYNLGNCDYASALQLAEKDRPAAVGRLEAAITNYRSALDIDSTDADARANIELAAQLIEQLREEQKQQEQQDQQQQDHQQKSEPQQGEDNAQQQQNQSSEGGENKEKQSTQGEPSKQDQSKSEQSSQDESKSKPQDRQESAAQNQPQQSPSKDQSGDAQADERDDKQGQQPPQGELTAAGEEDAKSDEPEKQNATAFDPAKDGELTQQEADKMLQAIRDRDMIRRLRRQAAERNQHVPVDRDW